MYIYNLLFTFFIVSTYCSFWGQGADSIFSISVKHGAPPIKWGFMENPWEMDDLFSLYRSLWEMMGIYK